MPAHAIYTFGVAEGDGEWESLPVTSRDMLEAERSWKGFSAQTFFANVTVENLYRLAFTTLRRRGRIEAGKGGTRFDEFVDEWSVQFDDPDEIRRRLDFARKLASGGASAGEIQAAVIEREARRKAGEHVDEDEAGGDPDEEDKGDDPSRPTA